MSTAELKMELINRITNTENEALLKAVSEFLANHSGDTVYQLSDEQVQAVNEARIQYKKGEFHTNDDLQKDMDEWLKD